jgi:hypothetical protein
VKANGKKQQGAKPDGMHTSDSLFELILCPEVAFVDRQDAENRKRGRTAAGTWKLKFSNANDCGVSAILLQNLGVYQQK